MGGGESSGGRMSVKGRGSGCFSGLRRFAATVFVLVAIGLVTLLFLVRTGGGRSLIEDRLSRFAGQPVTVERARIGWPYVLVLEGVQTEGFGAAGRPGWSVAALRCGLDPHGRRRLTLRQPRAHLVRNTEGAWRPSVLSPLGELAAGDIGDIAGATRPFRARWVVKAVHGSVRWLDARGVETGAAEEVTFAMQPVHVPGRRMVYYRLAVDTLRRGARAARFVEREWLASDADAYLELHAGGEPLERAGGFWQPAEDAR